MIYYWMGYLNHEKKNDHSKAYTRSIPNHKITCITDSDTSAGYYNPENVMLTFLSSR